MDGATAQGDTTERAARAPVDDTLFRTLARVVLLAAGVVLLFWFLYEIRRAVLLFVFALILMMVLNAPVTWLERKKLSRGLATMVVFGVVLALAGSLGWLVVPRLAEEIPTLVEELPQVVQEQSQQLSEWLGGAPQIDRQLSQLVTWLERAVGEAWRILDVAAAAFLFLIVTVAMVLYMVSNPRPILQYYVRSMPPHLREPAVRAFRRSSTMVVGWILANVIMGSIKATAAFIFLNFMEVPGALIWSFLALFAALIPRIGFYLMSIPPVLVALTVSPTTALWTLLFFWALSEFLGNFVAPRVEGGIMELHAVYLLFMAVAMGMAFGLLGVLVASPVAGFIKVFYEEFYLNAQPADPDLDSHVEKMVGGSVEGMRRMRRTIVGKEEG
jgi:putative permease